MKRTLTIILLFCSCFCVAQNVTLFTTADGLTSSLVKSVFEDKDGMIWVSTEAGLNRYDGTRFIQYRHDPADPHSLANNFVNTVCEDSKGNIFVCTHGGVQKYDPYTDSFSELARIMPENKASGQVSCVVERADGELWAAGNFLCRINIEDGKPSLSVVPTASKIEYVDYAAEDGEGNFWAVKYKKGVYKIHPEGTVQAYMLGGESVLDIYSDGIDGDIYLASPMNGLLRYDSAKDDFVRVGRDIMSANSIASLSAREMVVGNSGRGLYIYNTSTGHTRRISFLDGILDLNAMRVNAVSADNAGNLWLGIYQKGLALVPFRKNNFHYIGHDSSLDDLIGSVSSSAILRAGNGRLLVATGGDGLYSIDPDNNSSVHLSYPGIPDRISALFEDSKGYLWMSSAAGMVTRMDVKTGRCRQYDLEKETLLRINSVSGFAESADGTLWIATMGAGLITYDASRESFVSVASNFRLPEFLTSVIVGSDGDIYLGSYDGAYCFSNDGSLRLEAISTDNIINCINEQSPGIIAFGCENGLMIWSRDSGLKMYSTRDGLPDNTIYSVRCDVDGFTWILSSSGISKLDKDYRLLYTYGEEDGVRMGEAYGDISWQDADGVIWFGGLNGLTWFNPAEIVNSSKKWKVRVTGMYIRNEAVQGGMKSGRYTVLDRPIYEADKAELSHKDNAFTLILSTVEHGAPARLQYEYRLDRQDWIKLPAEGAGRLSFSGLSAGRHKFSFRTVDNGMVSDAEDFTVVIHPSVWAGPLAKCIYALLGICLVLLAYLWWRKHNLAKQQIREYQHTEQLNESKLQFFSNISHELKNPLSLIVGPLKKLMSTDDDPARQKYYKTMYRNCESILHLMDQLLDARKIDKGGMELKFRHTDIVPYIQNIIDGHTEQYALKHISLNFRHDGLGELYLWIDQTNFDKVLYNLLSNAYKFTPENGEVNVILEKKDNSAIIRVSDNGIGLSDADLEKVFIRFYQVSGGQKVYKGGTGVGLNLTRSLVELHHGEIHAEKNPAGQGTDFVVTLPLGRDQIRDEEIVRETENGYAAGSGKTEQPSILPVPEAAAAEKPAGVPKTRIRILLVDDDVELRRFLADELSSDFYIRQCGNGQEALEAIFEKTPDIVISDVVMPVMDGITLCDRIKTNININHIPVILLSGRSDEEASINGLKTGADAYITKPLSIDLLKTRILNLVESRRLLRNAYEGKQTYNDKITKVSVDSLDDKLMARIMRALDANLSNSDLTIEMLASEIGISRVHLHRKLKELTNQTTSDFIRNTRLAQAAKILSEGKHSISEVAVLVGFESQSNFSTAFKRLYGMTPREYMNQPKQ